PAIEKNYRRITSLVSTACDFWRRNRRPFPGLSPVDWCRMKKADIARRLAQQFRVSRGEAADRLDRVVSLLLADLRTRKSAALPGLGKFVRRADGSIQFKKD